MNRDNTTVTELPNLLQLPHPMQAAEHISHLATDTGCAFDCVRHVLGELSTSQQPGKFLYLFDLLYRLSLVSNAFISEALQRLQAEVIQALQAAVPQIPEQQKEQLELLRQKWLTAVQRRGRSGQVRLQDVATWLSAAGRTSNAPTQQQSSHGAVAAKPSQTMPPAAHMHVPPPSRTLTAPPPPPPRRLPPPPSAMTTHSSAAPAPQAQSSHHHSRGVSTMPASDPHQNSHSSRRSGWDAPAVLSGSMWNNQSQRQQPKHHAAQQGMHSRDASPEQLSQHMHKLSLQPANQAGDNQSRQQASTVMSAWEPNQPAPQDAAATLQVNPVPPQCTLWLCIN
ncbi:hypothetical protein ABBQ38_001807 [Trebouxia sp. C0009 RCD-2024]